MTNELFTSRRATIAALAGLSISGLPAWAQGESKAYTPPEPSPIEAVADFDVPGGQVVSMEYPPASARLRANNGSVRIRFQIMEAYADTSWAPLLGFSAYDEAMKLSLKADFVDSARYEHLVLATERVNFETHTSEPIANVMVPRFARRDTHEFDIGVEPGGVVVTIDGKRRVLKCDFTVNRLVVRASGVKGWIEFPLPASA